MRRPGLIVVGMALTAGAALVPILPAAGGNGVSVFGNAVCNPATGQYDVNWFVSNSSAGSVTISAAVQQPSGTDLAGAFTPSPVPSNGSAKAIGSVPGSTTVAVTLDVTYSDGGPHQVQGTVPALAGTCTVTATLQVGPSPAAAGDTVTISGTACFADDPGQGHPPGGTVNGAVAFTPPVAFGPVTAAADGSWSTTVVVPAGTLPGTYAVNAKCAVVSAAEVAAQAQQTFLYTASQVVVAVPAAPVAVPAAPRFTG